MDIYAISDLHLGPGADKGHYSSKWKDHQPAIRQAWDERIPDDAIVLMPGDFSWYQKPDDLIYDYYWIHDRPGQLKLLSPGNHDYGVWTSQSRVIDFCKRYDSLVPLMGDALRVANPYDASAPGLVVAAVRGTQSPGDKYFDSNSGASAKSQDPEAVLFIRELARLRAALRAADDVRRDGDELVVMIHYPPFVDGIKSGPYSDLIEASGARLCLYGHLHQEAQWTNTFQGERNGVEYRFVGTDFLGFAPTRIGEWDERGLTLNPVERQVMTTWTTKENLSSYGRHQTAATTTTKPKKPSVDGFGRERVCVECCRPVFEGDSFHYGTDGCRHGTGAFGTQGTCPEIHFAQVPTDKGGTVYGKVVCAECGLYVLKNEPRHQAVIDGVKQWIHGAATGVGSEHVLGTCRYKDDPEAARTRRAAPAPASSGDPSVSSPLTAAPAASASTDASATGAAVERGVGKVDDVLDEMRAHAASWCNGQLSEEDLVDRIEGLLEANPRLPII